MAELCVDENTAYILRAVGLGGMLGDSEEEVISALATLENESGMSSRCSSVSEGTPVAQRHRSVHIGKWESSRSRNSMILVDLTAQLLDRADTLLKRGLTSQTVTKRYLVSYRSALQFVEHHLVIPVETLDHQEYVHVARTRLLHRNPEELCDVVAPLGAKAAWAVRMTDKGSHMTTVHLESVRIIQEYFLAVNSSRVWEGLALPYSPRPETKGPAWPNPVVPAVIACLDLDLCRRIELDFWSEVYYTRPRIVETTTNRLLGAILEKIVDSGANVILATCAIDEPALSRLAEKGVLAIRQVDLKDLRAVARASGATFLTYKVLQQSKIIDKSFFGHAATVTLKSFGISKLAVITGTPLPAATIGMCSNNGRELNEMTAAAKVALPVVGSLMAAKSAVAAGGAFEAALSVYLGRHAATLAGDEQLVVREFSEALMVVPREIFNNALDGDTHLDTDDVMRCLRDYHERSQAVCPPDDALKRFGVDFENGQVRDTRKAGRLVPLDEKSGLLKVAVETTIRTLALYEQTKDYAEEWMLFCL